MTQHPAGQSADSEKITAFAFAGALHKNINNSILDIQMEMI